MIYLALAIIVALTLLALYGRKQMRDGANGAAAGGLTAAEAQKEYDAARDALARHFAEMAAPDPNLTGPLATEDRARARRREIDRLSERGAWMMDRIRGLEGAQTGPAPRIRYRMELMEAARRQAAQPGKRD